MPTVTLSPRRRMSRAPVLVVILALLLAACGRAGDPGERLAGAFEETFDGSFAYRFVVDADQAAMQGLGETAGQGAAFLSGFAIEGTVAEESMSLDLQALGSELLQVRSLGEDELYFRLGIQQLLAMLGGGFAAEDLLPTLDAMGIDEELQGAVLGALRGEWIGIEGEFDPSRLGDITGQDGEVDEEEARAAFEETFGEDVPTFFERFVVIEGDPEETEDGEQFTVALQLRELLRAATTMSEDLGTGDRMPLEDLEADLADLPETVPGEVVVSDGVVTAIVFRAADTIRESGTEIEGVLDLVLELSQHGDVEEVAAPDGAMTITAEQLQAALEQLGQGLGGFSGLDG